MWGKAYLNLITGLRTRTSCHGAQAYCYRCCSLERLYMNYMLFFHIAAVPPGASSRNRTCLRYTPHCTQKQDLFHGSLQDRSLPYSFFSVLSSLVRPVLLRYTVSFLHNIHATLSGRSQKLWQL